MKRYQKLLMICLYFSSGSIFSYPEISLLDFYEHILPTPLLIEYEKSLISEQTLDLNTQNILIFKLARNFFVLEKYRQSLAYFEMSTLHPISRDFSKNTSKKIHQIREIIYGEDLSQAIFFLDQENPNQALSILKPYMARSSYIVNMLMGKAYAMKNMPQKAKYFFQNASKNSQNQLEKKEAIYQLKKMTHWIEETKKPLPAIKPKIKIKENNRWLTTFSKGKQAYAQDNPVQAMEYFKSSYKLSQNDSEQKASLFFILKTSNWLLNYQEAFQAYRLLEKKSLNAEENNILLTEHAKTLLNLDYPRHAIYALSQTTPLKTADSILTLASCYLSAGLPYQTKKLVEQPQSQKILEKLPPNSYLANRKKDIDYQLMQTTSKGMLNFDFARIQDSTQFIINRETGEGNYRTFGVNSNTSVMLSKSQYYNPIHYVNSDILFIKQDFYNIHDKLDLSGAIIPTQVHYYNSLMNNPWNPMLWQVSANLKQNDVLNIYAFNNTVLVETIPALQNHILMNNSEGTVNLHPANFIYLNFTLAGSSFSDSNQRLGGAASLLYQLSSRYGVFSKIRYRRFQNSYYDNPNYFSPQSMQGSDLFLIFKKRLTMSTYLYAEGSVGLQQLQVNPTEELSNQTVYTTQINLAQKITKYAQLTLSYSYVQNVFNNLVGPYSQEYFGANFKIFID